jgi:cobalt/nickel transport system permease protein
VQSFYVKLDINCNRKVVTNMHMADALITPLVGGAMWAISSKVAGTSINKVKLELDDNKIPMMGVMGAFVFAAQMINFSIPGTGSSGHLGGGMLLAVILGPYAGFLVMAAILTIQALFFADGGLLALGCNLFNLGFYSCFIAYPYIYKGILKKGYTAGRIIGASTLASIVGLQLGSISVVAQTVLSGKIDLPFATFAILMQAIHLAIGIVEGLVTAAVINFVWKARPELIEGATKASVKYNISFRRIVVVFIMAAIMIGSILSWYASGSPDGLEWSLINSEGQGSLENDSWLHQKLADLQSKISVMPDYNFKEGERVMAQGHLNSKQGGTSLSGVLGGLMTLLLALGIGLGIRFFTIKSKDNNAK